MTLTATITTMIVSFLIPGAVALVTKSNAGVWLKQFVAALAAAITGVVVTATQLDGTAVISKQSVVLAAGAFFLSQATYVGVYRPHDANAKIAPTVGVG